MGVPGLWDVIRPAGKARSLTHLAVVDGYEKNRDGKRGYRIGIDASIWFFHAAYGREGENPELRTLFFRCSRLMSMPFLPLFVFDGPKRPAIKRGSRISGNSHWLTTGMRNIIDAFGFEWRTAPGEAEAELAYLNRIGVIDAVLSDDVDNFLFGARIVVRNPSSTLSGNRAHSTKNAAGKDDGQHVTIYEAEEILTNKKICLTRGGFILIGLLSGGDYHQAGLPRCGPQIAHSLARCGFGDDLLRATQDLSHDELPDFLNTWREEVRSELRTNSQGFLGRKHPSLAKSLPDDFPHVDILLSYTNPITTESECSLPVQISWDREPDLSKISGLCELYFEWGVKDIIIKRFRTVLWPSMVLRIMRRTVLDTDAKLNSIPSTPSKSRNNTITPHASPSKMIAKRFTTMHLTESDDESDDEEQLIVKIHSSRNHASTDGLLEYRLEIAPSQLVRLSEAGIKGIRPDISAPDELEDNCDDSDVDDVNCGTKKAMPNPQCHLRIWMPASIVRAAEPNLVENFDATRKKRAVKKAGKQPSRKTTAKLVRLLPPSEGGRSPPSSRANSVTRDSRLAKPTRKTTTQKPSTRKPPTNPNKKELSPRASRRNITGKVRDTASNITSDDDEEHPAPVLSLSTLKPKAFPLALSDDADVFSAEVVLRSVPAVNTSSPRKKPVSSDSESNSSRIQKSPRKTIVHTSPRSKGRLGRKSHESLLAYAVPSHRRSPSPTQRLSSSRTVPCPDSSVIEISSESDIPSPARALPPLLRAKARGQIEKVQGTIDQSFKQSKLRSAARAKKLVTVSSQDVIDLT